MSATTYFPLFDDLITVKPSIDRAGTYTGWVFLVEAITSGKRPIHAVGIDGTRINVSEDWIAPYREADHIQVKAAFGDTSPLKPGQVLRVAGGTGGLTQETLWVLVNMASSGLYAIAPLGATAPARRGYTRSQFTLLTLTEVIAALTGTP